MKKLEKFKGNNGENRFQEPLKEHTIAHNKMRIRNMAIRIIRNFVTGEYAEVDEGVIHDSRAALLCVQCAGQSQAE